MDWLSDASKNHKEYVSYIKKMGYTSHAEDLVQDMYLRLHKYKHAIKFNKDGSVPKSYIYRILYNLFIDYKKDSSKFRFIQVDKSTTNSHNIMSGVTKLNNNNDFGYRQYPYEQIDIEKHVAYDKLLEDTFSSIESLDNPSKYPYNKELLSLYIESGMSMRQISALTGISLTSIHWTIKNCREQIKEDVGETLQDYINQDYERI